MPFLSPYPFWRRMKKNVLIEKKKIPYRLIMIAAGIIVTGLVCVLLFATKSNAAETETESIVAVSDDVNKKVEVKQEEESSENEDAYDGKAYYYSKLETLIAELASLTED